jgi:eukaryotic-like serine/threonine-protein kinase
MTARLEDLAAAILDGQPVDWRAVDAELSPEERAYLAPLRDLATVREMAQTEGSTGTPAQWGHLRVLEPIGRGAFGTVYRAWDSRLDRAVALKLIDVASPRSATSGSTGIIEEGRLLARVRHPNVVSIYGADRLDDRVGLWMELIEGRTLARLLRDGPRPAAADIVRIGADLCHAATAVHAAGLLHRDITAQNIMIGSDERLVLMDFGAGHAVGSPSGPGAGTPLYLAPEVLAGGAASVRSDVYSIGVVLYQLLTGTFPVHASTLDGLRREHATRADAATLSFDRTVPRPLREVVRRALAADAGKRFASAAEMGAALSALPRQPSVMGWAYAGLAGAIALVLLATLGRMTDTGSASRPTPSVTTERSASRATTLAVLPFINLSREPDSDDFVDGLTAEVIHDLAGLDGLDVRSQTSSFALKGARRDMRAVRDRLGVDFVVEADVLRVGSRLRVNARLIAAETDAPLWAERFDRRVDDVFEIQDEISRAIVDRLRLTLDRGQRRYRTHLGAYETYLRARALVARRGNESAQRAKDLFEQVIAVDPSFPPAYAGLAEAYSEMSWQLTGLSADEGLKGMRPMAERALALDPLLAEAHAAMGATFARERQWREAAAAFERALALNTTFTQIQANYALNVLALTGDLARAERLLVDATTADPLSAAVRRDLGWVRFYRGRFDEAIADFRQALAWDPLLPFATQGIARALTFAGRPDEAVAVWLGRPATDGDWEIWMTRAYVLLGRTADVNRIEASPRNEHPSRRAVVLAAVGDREAALTALERAVELAPNRTAAMLHSPELAPVRTDPRLTALLTRLNLR